MGLYILYIYLNTCPDTKESSVQTWTVKNSTNLMLTKIYHHIVFNKNFVVRYDALS